MKAEYEIRTGHVLDELAKIESESVNCVVTSPPYWGQRDYAGVPDTEWSDGWVGQFGHEPTPEQYVEHTLDVMRGVRRVLRGDGVVWWNIGDNYVNKSLSLMPFRVALAAQADGWWVRSVVIWAKSNAKPESVTDRLTTAHEYVLLLTKSAKYWYDAVAVREGGVEHPGRAGTFARNGDVAEHIIPNQGYAEHRSDRGDRVPTGRNLRTVWTFATAQTPEAHFATFPRELPRRCIEASCPLEVCQRCGVARMRVVVTKRVLGKPRVREGQDWQRQSAYRLNGEGTSITTGWTSCDCEESDYQPGLVLDPFMGIGTTLSVAQELGRDSIGIEISPKYVKMAKKKIEDAARAR